MSLSQSWMPPAGRIRLASSTPSIRHDDQLSQTPTSQPHLESSYLTTIQRRASELQQHLQDLLNDQSDLLAAQAPHNYQADSIHSTQSYSSSRAGNGRAVPVRQPISHRSLTTIRKDLQYAMTELATLRHDEAQHLENELHATEDTTNLVDSWQDRRQRLEQEMETLQDTQGASRLDKLQQDDTVLSEEINALDLQLAELRSRQRVVRSELSLLSNTVQSKMSSYRASMELLDKEVQAFLASQKPPRGKPTAMNGSARWMSHSQIYASASCLADVAASNAESTSRLHDAQDAAVAEQKALEAGVKTWAAVNTSLRMFERQLAQYLRQARGGLVHDTSPGHSMISSSRPVSRVELLELMDRTMEELKRTLSYVEEQGWNLLVCAIGAEVQAFRAGREILAEMLQDQDEVDEQTLDVKQKHIRKPSLRESINGGSLRSSRDMRTSDPRQSNTQIVHSPVRTYVRRRERPYLAGSGEEDEADDDTDANS